MKLFKNIKDNFPRDRYTQIFLALMVILALVGAVLGYRYARKLVSTNETFSLSGDPVVGDGDASGANGDVDATNPDKPTEIPAADLPKPDPWDGVSRVNLLVMGLDYRDWEAGETPRTDTMIVFTLDPLNNTAGMISIPRDLWVTIPGFESGKINTAYYLGEVYNLPGGGPGLAASTVEELLGVPIHYYAQIDFQAFVDFIDHIEGVRLTFDEPMVLDRLGKWNTVTIEPGVITLPGEYALAYVRARKTGGGDFDRAERQQILIMAIRDRILEFDMMPKLVARAPEIYNDLAAGIRTNMNLNEVIKLGWSALAVNRGEIKQVVITNEYVTLGKSSDDLDILMPVPDKIRLLRDEVFAEGAALGPVAEGELLDLVVEEGSRVSIRNGSSQSDLATRTADWFREQGIDVVEEVNTDYNLITRVYFSNSMPYVLNWLSETMGISSSSFVIDNDTGSEIDVIVVLGDDWAAQNPMP